MIDTLETYTDGRPAPTPETYWPMVGESYNRSAPQRGIIASQIAQCDWQAVVPGLRMPFSQGYAINRLIRISRGSVRRIAWNGVIGAMGFYGLEVVYVDGVGRNFYLDSGGEVTPVRSDFYRDAAGNSAAP